jgi:8-oxo-dGTP diphosphatase
MPTPAAPSPGYPYKIAVLCDIRNSKGEMLLLHRLKEPNKGLFSPIGGKLDTASGESPTQCARREVHEEARVDIPLERFRLVGMISERGYESKTNWLLFYFRVDGPVDFEPFEMNEGRLEWHMPDEIDHLPLPETDRKIIWPLVKKHDAPGGFFAVHIDCDIPGGGELKGSVEQSWGT